MQDSWTPPRWDITIPAGADFDDFIQWKPDGVTPAILDGFSFKQEFRRRFDDQESLLTITDADCLSPEPEGIVRYSIPAIKTSLLGDVRPVDTVTALEATSPAGKVYRLFDGVWTVTPEATK